VSRKMGAPAFGVQVDVARDGSEALEEDLEGMDGSLSRPPGGRATSTCPEPRWSPPRPPRWCPARRVRPERHPPPHPRAELRRLRQRHQRRRRHRPRDQARRRRHQPLPRHLRPVDASAPIDDIDDHYYQLGQLGKGRLNALEAANTALGHRRPACGAHCVAGASDRPLVHEPMRRSGLHPLWG